MFDSPAFSSFKSICARVLALTLFNALVTTSVMAAGGAPRISILDAQVAQDSSGNQTALFDVIAIYEPYLVECLPNEPNCNARQLSFCVRYQTAAGTATANLDYGTTSNQLQKTVLVDGPDEILIGTVHVQIIGDSIEEGTETFTVTLTNGTGCTNNGALDDFIAVGTIVDGALGTPDLTVTDIVVTRSCQLSMTLKNTGTGSVPEAAYSNSSGAVVQMMIDGIAWGGVRLFIADPSRALQTPGASVTHVWFPNTPNLLLPSGVHSVEAVIDSANSVVESIETNNTRRERMICFGT